MKEDKNSIELLKAGIEKTSIQIISEIFDHPLKVVCKKNNIKMDVWKDALYRVGTVIFRFETESGINFCIMIKECLGKPLYTFEVALVNYYSFDDQKSLEFSLQCAENLGYKAKRKTNWDIKAQDPSSTSSKVMHFGKNNDGEYTKSPHLINVHKNVVNDENFEKAIDKIFFEIKKILIYFKEKGVIKFLQS